MSESLPEDMRKWPDNPFELLGITQHVDLREVRRTYTRLIRTFTPEKFPEHFQRIRAAYEYVQTMFDNPEAREAGIVINAPRSQSPKPTDESKQKGLEPVSPELVEEVPPELLEDTVGNSPAVESRLDKCWQMAIDGDWPSAYRGLVEVHRRSVDTVECTLRLYWLLTLDPSLDPSRKSLDWLLEGMRRTSASGRLCEVSWSAMEDEADLLKISFSLLDQEASLGSLRRLCQLRWSRAVSTGKWDQIGDDLDRLRSRMGHIPSSMWAGFLFQAIDFLAVSGDPHVFRHVGYLLSEIAGFPELELSLEQEHFRAESAMVLAKERLVLHEASDTLDMRGFFSRSIIDLVPKLWTNPEIQQRTALLQFASIVALQPRTAIAEFDRFVKTIGPWHLQFVCEVLQRLPRPGIDPTFGDDDLAKEKIAKFLDLIAFGTYASVRFPVLEFCLREWLSPLQVATFVEGTPKYLAAWGLLPGGIRNDVSMRLVWAANFALGVAAMPGV